MKGNGKPLFVLANAVDDRTMAISHVIRGEDQLPTTPRQILLWGALNAAEGADLALPAYAHLPLLVNEAGKKLSKRRDPVAVEMYREQGYLPEAFRNYLALLGWSPGEEEIVPLEVLLERFRLEDVQRSPAFFDIKKLAHIDGVYIRALAVGEFVAASRPWVDPVPGEWGPGAWRDPDTGAPATEPPAWDPARFDPAVFAALAAVTQERVTVLGEVPELVDFLFLPDAPDDPDSWQKAVAGDELAPRILADALAAYETCSVGRRLAARGDAGAGRVGRTQARQGPGPHPGGGHGPDPWSSALRLARRARPRRDTPAHRRRAGPPRTLLDVLRPASLGAAHRRPRGRR